MKRLFSLVLALALAVGTAAVAQNAGRGPRGGDKDGDGKCDCCGRVAGEQQRRGKMGKGRCQHGRGQCCMNQQQAPEAQKK